MTMTFIITNPHADINIVIINIIVVVLVKLTAATALIGQVEAHLTHSLHPLM